MKANKTGQIMVALDFPTVEQALDLIDKLKEFKPIWKIGMQLFYLAGPSLVSQLKERGFSIFLDLKLHDIPNTVKGAAQSLTALGVDFITVHCAGGKSMMEAALEGIELGRQRDASISPVVVGVTQLTSTSQEMLNQEIGIPGSMEQAILHYARLAEQSGLHGVVCSPLEVKRIKESIGKSFITITPGIRPLQDSLDDQARVTTPSEAVSLGTDYMVIGRAITKAEDPVQAYESILMEIDERKGEMQR